MAILLKSGGLFLHVPKTGGNWVSEVLESSDLVFAHVGGKHAGPAQLAPLEQLLHVPHRYDRTNRPLFRFCFVRHPLRWYESWFRMCVARGWPQWAADDEVWNPSVELNGLGADTFNGFIENVLRERPGFLSGLYDCYTKDAHFVGRQEHMAEDLLIVLTYLKTTVDEALVRGYQPTNVSEAVDVRLDWSLQQALEEAERDAFARYGYATSEGGAQAPASAPLTPFSPTVMLRGPFLKERGFAWQIGADTLARFADNEEQPYRSMVSLLENGMPLRQGHAAHDDIRTIGGGRFSHWREMLLFSTSDNSDPNETGRRYDLAWVFPAPFDSTDLMLKRPSTAGVSQ